MHLIRGSYVLVRIGCYYLRAGCGAKKVLRQFSVRCEQVQLLLTAEGILHWPGACLRLFGCGLRVRDKPALPLHLHFLSLASPFWGSYMFVENLHLSLSRLWDIFFVALGFFDVLSDVVLVSGL